MSWLRRVRPTIKGAATSTVIGITAFSMLATLGGVVAIRRTVTPPPPVDCTADNPTAPTFPCRANTGPRIALKLVTHTAPDGCTSVASAVDKPNCPQNTVYNAGFGYALAACGTTWAGFHFTEGLNLYKGNGFTDGSLAHACLHMVDMKIDGKINMSFQGGQCNAVSNHYCGPLVAEYSELDASSGNVADTGAITFDNFYLDHFYEHGGRTAFLCDGPCSITNSYATDNIGSTGQHMGSFLSNGNSGRPIVLDHNTWNCNGITGNHGDCSAALNFYGDNSAISNVIVNNNLIKAGDGLYCSYEGAVQPAKPFPNGSNLTWTNNVYERGANGHCGSTTDPAASVTFDWFGTPAAALSAGSQWCNNTYTDGPLVKSAWETC